MKIWVVVVQFYASDPRLTRFLSRFRSILSKEGIDVSEIRVDIRQSDAFDIVRFPFLDISGYVHGLAQVPAGVPVLMVNDTYFVKHPWRSYTKSLAKVLKPLASLDSPCAAGAVFPTQNLLLLDHHNLTRRHVCTFMVAFNAQGREVMEALASSLPGPGQVEVQRWLEVQTARHRALELMCSLHFAQIPNPWRWPGLAGHPSVELVQRKFVTVAFEYMLSVALLQAGGMVLPINVGSRQWFAEQLERLLLRIRSLTIPRSNRR